MELSVFLAQVPVRLKSFFQSKISQADISACQNFNEALGEALKKINLNEVESEISRWLTPQTGQSRLDANDVIFILNWLKISSSDDLKLILKDLITKNNLMRSIFERKHLEMAQIFWGLLKQIYTPDEIFEFFIPTPVVASGLGGLVNKFQAVIGSPDLSNFNDPIYVTLSTLVKAKELKLLVYDVLQTLSKSPKAISHMNNYFSVWVNIISDGYTTDYLLLIGVDKFTFDPLSVPLCTELSMAFNLYRFIVARANARNINFSGSELSVEDKTLINGVKSASSKAMHSHVLSMTDGQIQRAIAYNWVNNYRLLHLVIERNLTHWAKFLVSRFSVDINGRCCANTKGERPIDVATRRNLTELYPIFLNRFAADWLISTSPDISTGQLQQTTAERSSLLDCIVAEEKHLTIWFNGIIENNKLSAAWPTILNTLTKLKGENPYLYTEFLTYIHACYVVNTREVNPPQTTKIKKIKLSETQYAELNLHLLSFLYTKDNPQEWIAMWLAYLPEQARQNLLQLELPKKEIFYQAYLKFILDVFRYGARVGHINPNGECVREQALMGESSITQSQNLPGFECYQQKLASIGIDAQFDAIRWLPPSQQQALAEAVFLSCDLNRFSYNQLVQLSSVLGRAHNASRGMDPADKPRDDVADRKIDSMDNLNYFQHLIEKRKDLIIYALAIRFQDTSSNSIEEMYHQFVQRLSQSMISSAQHAELSKKIIMALSLIPANDNLCGKLIANVEFRAWSFQIDASIASDSLLEQLILSNQLTIKIQDVWQYLTSKAQSSWLDNAISEAYATDNFNVKKVEELVRLISQIELSAHRQLLWKRLLPHVLINHITLSEFPDTDEKYLNELANEWYCFDGIAGEQSYGVILTLQAIMAKDWIKLLVIVKKQHYSVAQFKTLVHELIEARMSNTSDEAFKFRILRALFENHSLTTCQTALLSLDEIDKTKLLEALMARPQETRLLAQIVNILPASSTCIESIRTSCSQTQMSFLSTDTLKQIAQTLLSNKDNLIDLTFDGVWIIRLLMSPKFIENASSADIHALIARFRVLSLTLKKDEYLGLTRALKQLPKEIEQLLEAGWESRIEHKRQRLMQFCVDDSIRAILMALEEACIKEDNQKALNVLSQYLVMSLDGMKSGFLIEKGQTFLSWLRGGDLQSENKVYQLITRYYPKDTLIQSELRRLHRDKRLYDESGDCIGFIADDGCCYAFGKEADIPLIQKYKVGEKLYNAANILIGILNKQNKIKEDNVFAHNLSATILAKATQFELDQTGPALPLLLRDVLHHQSLIDLYRSSPDKIQWLETKLSDYFHSHDFEANAFAQFAQHSKKGMVWLEQTNDKEKFFKALEGLLTTDDTRQILFEMPQWLHDKINAYGRARWIFICLKTTRTQDTAEYLSRFMADIDFTAVFEHLCAAIQSGGCDKAIGSQIMTWLVTDEKAASWYWQTIHRAYHPSMAAITKAHISNFIKKLPKITNPQTDARFLLIQSVLQTHFSHIFPDDEFRYSQNAWRGSELNGLLILWKNIQVPDIKAKIWLRCIAYFANHHRLNLFEPIHLKSLLQSISSSSLISSVTGYFRKLYQNILGLNDKKIAQQYLDTQQAIIHWQQEDKEFFDALKNPNGFLLYLWHYTGPSQLLMNGLTNVLKGGYRKAVLENIHAFIKSCPNKTITIALMQVLQNYYAINPKKLTQDNFNSMVDYIAQSRQIHKWSAQFYLIEFWGNHKHYLLVHRACQLLIDSKDCLLQEKIMRIRQEAFAESQLTNWVGSRLFKLIAMIKRLWYCGMQGRNKASFFVKRCDDMTPTSKSYTKLPAHLTATLLPGPLVDAQVSHVEKLAQLRHSAAALMA